MYIFMKHLVNDRAMVARPAEARHLPVYSAVKVISAESDCTIVKCQNQ